MSRPFIITIPDGPSWEVWKPSMELRWYRHLSGTLELQQRWVSDKGKEEWRAIQVVQ